MNHIDRFRRRFLSKLPEGSAFRRDAESVFYKLFGALSQECVRIDDELAAVLAQAPPWESLDMLPDWERVLAIPASGSIPDRQAAVGAKIADQGGCSRDYFVALAATLGYDITITEYLPWRVGIATCVDPLIGIRWQSTWTVTYASGPRDALLKATLIAARPAHTCIHFVVDGDALVVDGDVVTSGGDVVIF
jgi:uncharacterized protein YmfQ (DUF2313 family)